MLFYESTFNDLYSSAVTAFPNTTKRQFVTQPVQIHNLQIIPFIGMKTLFLKSEAVNGDRHYNTIILVKGIQYEHEIVPGTIEITASDGQTYRLYKPSLENDDVLVRCSCPDHHWRFVHYNHLDHSLYGKDRKKYEAKYNPGSANPTKSPGMCKHLMKFAEVLRNSYLFD